MTAVAALEPMRVALLEWRALERNTLRGFAVVQVGGLKIKDITVHEKNGTRWVGLPAKPVIGADGKAQTDDRGKIRYAQILEWATKDAAERFGAGVCRAVEAAYPDAFDAS